MLESTSSGLPRLAEHVRACQVGDQMIFLDLLRSRYIGVGGPMLPSLAEAILEEAVHADASSAAPNAALLEVWFKRLREQNLLSNSSERVPAKRTTRPIEPVESLNAENETGSRAYACRDLLRLWRATFIASMWIRDRSLADIAERVTKLRTRHAQRAVDADVDAMPSAVAAYVRLRPLALTSHDRCLNDSLTLVHFLATQGLFPQWVIGVRVHPFAAHSWVQSGGVVLNDLAELVRHYQPILVV